MLADICFITSHPNPSNHFVEYVKAYEERNINCKVIADKSVSSKFSSLKSKVVVIDTTQKDFLSKIEGELGPQSIAITDIASEKWVELNSMLAEKRPDITRAVYYDNPEKFVPGAYSTLAKKVIDSAQVVLFANASLVDKGIESEKGVFIDLSDKHCVGIGYYPKKDSSNILEIKNNAAKVEAIKATLLEKNEVSLEGQKILVYAGGANDVYYNQAFPHFTQLMTELSQRENSPLKNTTLVLQQHPRAKKEGNIDAKLFQEFVSSHDLPEGFNFIVSDIPTSEALAIADGVFYYQTSMAAQFVFAKIPSVIQVGHEPYSDLLVQVGFPSVTGADELAGLLSKDSPTANVAELEKELGILPDWKENVCKVAELREPALTQ